MKAIMISIKPKWCAKIMNGEKTIEVRKNKALANAIQKLIDENGYADIYVYCSKDDYLYRTNKGYIASKKPLAVGKGTEYTFAYSDEGKVIFKFHCYKVEEILPFIVRETKLGFAYELTEEKIINCQKAQLTYDEYSQYLNGKSGYAIHISDLEIFNDPKELSEFKSHKKNIVNTKINGMVFETEFDNSLTNAPQNFVYLEVER